MANELSTSVSSIKRYTQELDSSFNIEIVRGGIKNNDLEELDNSRKKTLNIDHKKRIAAKALAKISDHDIIFIDAGTSTIELAKIMPDNMKVTIFSNNLDIVPHLKHKNIPTYIIGGRISYNTSAVSGSVAQDMISKMSFSIAFLGCNGYDEKGFYTTNISESTFKRFVATKSNKVFFLADDSKKNVKQAFKIQDMNLKSIIR